MWLKLSSMFKICQKGPIGKQHDYICFVTLGNQPETAERPIHYTHSPTGVLLQQDMARRCPMCTALLPFQLACTL